MLTDTFRHAIDVTRKLGLRHLWIDSLCIVQGPEGDFVTESKRMEDVFSSAYCVVAASSARSQRDGFLVRERKARQVLPLKVQGGTLYVCRFIDRFDEHVLNSPLSKRGWVLQERALARRTIYFTDWQVYWECGDGVRCETLTKLDKLVSFSDADRAALTCEANWHHSSATPIFRPSCRATWQTGARRSGSSRSSIGSTRGWSSHA